MRKILLLAALSVFCAAPLMAESYVIPRDSLGQLPADAGLVGVDVIDSTSTTGVGLSSPCLLYWVVVSSDAVTNFATLRDTDTVNTSSNIKMRLFPDNSGGTSLASGSTVLKLDPPAIFRNGISIHLNAASSTSTGRWHFGIRRRTLGNVRGTDTAFTDTAD